MPYINHYPGISSKQHKNPQYNTRLTSLEKFLAYSFSKGNLAEEVISEKAHFQKASLDQMLNLIKERECSKYRNLSHLDSEIMGLQARLYPYLCHVYPIAPDNKRKSNLERAISELKNKRRHEEVDCWKDTSKLWQELLKNAVDYKAAKRRKAFCFPENKNGYS